MAKAVKEGNIEGPNIYSSGSAIGMTGGHTDKHSIPLPVVPCVNAHGSPADLADGPDGAIRAVRLQLRKGARLIKICGTGGAGSLLDDPRHRHFSDTELRAFVGEAERSAIDCCVALPWQRRDTCLHQGGDANDRTWVLSG